jgi:hypothetical protein
MKRRPRFKTPPSLPPPLSTSLHLGTLVASRDLLPPAEFRLQLRQYLLDHPQVRLQRVADEFGLSRQRIGALVGKLGRPGCCPVGPRPAPEREKAAAGLAELERRVAAGEPASRAADDLGLSLSMAMRLGFRVKSIRPVHGTWDRAKLGCGCWRCRVVAGVAIPRAKRMTRQLWAILDWLAWVDPDDGRGLSQTTVGRLVGVGQMAVSRVARGAVGMEMDENPRTSPLQSCKPTGMIPPE